MDKTRPGCIDPAAARLVRLPRGKATEMMQNVSWYSLGCRLEVCGGLASSAPHLPWIRYRPLWRPSPEAG